MLPGYPAPGWATTQVYLARITPDYPKENPLFVLNSSQLVSYVGLETLC